MPGLALILWLVFGVVALGGRILLQLRLARLRGVPASAALRLGRVVGRRALRRALVVAGAAPVLQLADVVEPIDALDTTAVQIAGIVLYAIGLAGCVGAQLAMGASWRIGVDESERTDLVTDGPFAIVRNPIYSARDPARRRARPAGPERRLRSRRSPP